MNTYIYIYIHTVATSCDLNAPRCTTEVLRVRLHGSRGGVFIGHRPPPDPGDPPLIDIYKVIEVLHENLHRSCVLTGGLCFMDWAPPNRHQTLHFGPKRNHAILMDSWLTGGTKRINHKAMQV